MGRLSTAAEPQLDIGVFMELEHRFQERYERHTLGVATQTDLTSLHGSLRDGE
jgi:hypothetical protein